jgi:hypothetical protein
MFFPDKVRATVPDAQIVATDINPGVVEFAARHVPSERATFQVADAQSGKQALSTSSFETVELTSRVTAREASQGIVLGSPFRAEIERLGAAALEGATAAVFEALLPWDGKDAPMSAHVATATAPSSSSHA